MTDPRLFLWPKGVDVTAVKAIVEGLKLGYTVKPFWFDIATSEDAERVLVLADGFEHSPVVDYIYPKNPALLQESVEWALGIRETSRGARLASEKMLAIFGESMRVWDEIQLGEEWVRVGDEGTAECEEGSAGG